MAVTWNLHNSIWIMLCHLWACHWAFSECNFTFHGSAGLAVGFSDLRDLFQSELFFDWESHCPGNKLEWVSCGTHPRKPGKDQPLTSVNSTRYFTPWVSCLIRGSEWKKICINLPNLLFVWFITFTTHLMPLHKYITLLLFFFPESCCEAEEPPAWLHSWCGLKAEREHERGKQCSFAPMAAPAIKHT